MTQRRDASGLARDIEIVELLATAHSGDGMGVSQLDPQMTASGFSVLAAPPRDKTVVRDFHSLLAELAHIRQVGYAILDEELETGVVGASAPVRDFTGSIIAAINVSAPKARMTNRLEELGACVAGAAAGLSLRIGASKAGRNAGPDGDDM